jgi:hypothetical protein
MGTSELWIRPRCSGFRGTLLDQRWTRLARFSGGPLAYQIDVQISRASAGLPARQNDLARIAAGTARRHAP